MWIDSHCHLNHKNFQKHDPPFSPALLVQEAVDNSVDGLLTICTRIDAEFQDILAIAHQHPNVWCALGTHPHHAGLMEEKSYTRDDIVKLARSDPKIIGIGESGLDYHYNFSSPEDQQAAFRKHIQACLETDLPLIIHARDADEDIIKTLREEGSGTPLKGVLHCFSSGRALADYALEIGFYISLSGIITFPKADDLRSIAKDIPLDRLLVETDAPYLAPMPHRGRINRPVYVKETGRFLAEMLSLSEAEIARATSKNFFCLFDKAALQ